MNQYYKYNFKSLLNIKNNKIFDFILYFTIIIILIFVFYYEENKKIYIHLTLKCNDNNCYYYCYINKSDVDKIKENHTLQINDNNYPYKVHQISNSKNKTQDKIVKIEIKNLKSKKQYLKAKIILKEEFFKEVLVLKN